MAGEFDKFTIRESAQRVIFSELLNAAGTTGPAARLQGRIFVQIAGPATQIEAIVERSTLDPGTGEDWAPADYEAFSGDLSAGISPRQYEEPSIGWWRVRVPILVGGFARISIMGTGI